MTAAQLLVYILVALLLQVGAGVVLTVRRRAAALAAAPVSASTPASEEAVHVDKGAWSGWRDFRVVRREFEDVAQSQCSFYLQAVDGAPLAPFLNMGKEAQREV